MSNYNYVKKRDDENENVNGSFKDAEKDNLKHFKHALTEALDLKILNIIKEIEDIELSEPSIRHKMRMNRIFRENAGISYIPFPEVEDPD